MGLFDKLKAGLTKTRDVLTKNLDNLIFGKRVLDQSLYDELEELEQFVRWHNDMDINVEGIEALHHMLMRVKLLQAEIDSLKNELQFYRSLI